MPLAPALALLEGIMMTADAGWLSAIALGYLVGRGRGGNTMDVVDVLIPSTSRSHVWSGRQDGGRTARREERRTRR
jgi:hypothetical protein